MLPKKTLPLRPNRAGGIECLQLDTHEVARLAVSDRNEAIVDTPAGYGKLGDDTQFISRFVPLEQMNAVGEDLASLKETKWADHYRLRLTAIGHGACAYSDFGFALAVLEALAIKEWALLFERNGFPLRWLGSWQPVKFRDLRLQGGFRHRSSLHLSCADRTYSAAISRPTDFLPSRNATRLVVPVPANGSSTKPLDGQVVSNGIRHRSSG